MMKIRIGWMACAMSGWVVLISSLVPGETTFFRVVSPTTTVITAFNSDGVLVWSNGTEGVTCNVQRAITQLDPSNWTDFATYMVTGVVMSSRVFDTHPPAGMVLIPAGMNIGTDPDFGAYSFTLSEFYMDRYEVTKAQWDEVYNWAITNGYSFDNEGSGKGLDHPVQRVNWYDCVKWCNARSEKEGLTPAYYINSAQSTVYKTGQTNIEDDCVNWLSGYRLPKETEWEYAARGGVSGKRFPWGGDTIDHDKANYYGYPDNPYDLGYVGYDTRYSLGDLPYTSPVGAFEAGKNGYGLYDMAGNVWEWCWDWYPGYEGAIRIDRGGSWYFAAYGARVAFRDMPSDFGFPSNADHRLGFRAVLPANL